MTGCLDRSFRGRTFRFNIALITLLSAGDMCDGNGGSLPDLTIVMSSAWVWAVENGELGRISEMYCGRGANATTTRQRRRNVAATHASAHISKTRQPKLQMSDLVSYLFSARISGGIYSGVFGL